MSDELIDAISKTPFTFDPSRCNHLGRDKGECPHCGGGKMNIAELLAPTDTLEAFETWEATCGPAALAAILGRSVMSLREKVKPYRGFMSIADMLRSLRSLKVEHTLMRKDFNQLIPQVQRGDYIGRLSIIQWGGSWLTPGVHPGASLCRTHWIAYRHSPPVIYDVNADGWISTTAWETVMAPEIMRHVRGCDGTWRTRSTILIKDAANV